MNPSTESTRPYTLRVLSARPGIVAEPLRCLIMGLLPTPATCSMDACTCGEMRARTRKTYARSPKDAHCTHGCTHHFPLLLFHFNCLFFFSPRSLYSNLVFISPYCSLALHGSTLFFAQKNPRTRHTHTAPFLIPRKGLRLIFFSITRFKGRSNHCCPGADACG